MIKLFLTGHKDDSLEFLPKCVRFFGGGGGGGDGGASAAQQEEAERRTRQKNNIGEIRSIIQGGTGSRPVTETATESMSRFHGRNADFNQQADEIEARLAQIPANDPNTAEERFRLEQEAKNLRRRIFDPFQGVATNQVAFDHGASQADRIQAAQDAVGEFFQPLLEDQRNLAERRGKFQLLRQGIAEGSGGIDFRKEVQKRFDKGLEQVATKKLQAGDSVRSRDASLENNLISQAIADVGRDSLIGSAQRGLESNATAAQNDARNSSLDEHFLNAGNLFSNIAVNQGAQQGTLAAQALLNGNQNRTSFNNNNISTGRITNT